MSRSQSEPPRPRPSAIDLGHTSTKRGKTAGRKTLVKHARKADVFSYKRVGAAKLKKVSEMGKNIHVVPQGKGWAVKPERSAPTSTHRTQQAAIEKARSQAKQNQSELLIHKRDGEIREKNTYGKDRFPPKG